MHKKMKNWSRRNFIKTAGAAGVGSMLTPIGRLANASNQSTLKISEQMVVPTRPFGKTGVNVSMLALGGILDLMYYQLLLRQTLKMGVTYWDTAESYLHGNSEAGIGKYFARYPEDRKKIFLVTKTDSRDPDNMTLALNGSLATMKTSYIDLYFLHDVSDVEDEINQKTRNWAEKAKADGKIRFFGFSTHSNMEGCMIEAAKLGWIDGIMIMYNYRLMHTDGMKEAVDACAKAGIGLTAMKAQASSVWHDVGKESEAALKLTEQFQKKGFTFEQAKLKAVWQNPHIASICTLMQNTAVLEANAAAALDRTHLSLKDMKMLEQHARETASGYCAGCANICESAIEGDVPISKMMRCLMYYRSYGDRDQARTLFKELPPDTRKRMISLDYSKAEKRCPQEMPIGRLMREAAKELA